MDYFAELSLGMVADAYSCHLLLRVKLDPLVGLGILLGELIGCVKSHVHTVNHLLTVNNDNISEQ